MIKLIVQHMNYDTELHFALFAHMYLELININFFTISHHLLKGICYQDPPHSVSSFPISRAPLTLNGHIEQQWKKKFD